jgi:hypothetical protein
MERGNGYYWVIREGNPEILKFEDEVWIGNDVLYLDADMDFIYPHKIEEPSTEGTRAFLQNFINNCESSKRLNSVQTAYFCTWARKLLGLPVNEKPWDGEIHSMKFTMTPDSSQKNNL